MTAYDVLLKNATVVDPASGRVEAADLAWRAGRSPRSARTSTRPAPRSVRPCRLHLLPGIVDMHMHASAWLGGGRGTR